MPKIGRESDSAGTVQVGQSNRGSRAKANGLAAVAEGLVRSTDREFAVASRPGSENAQGASRATPYFPRLRVLRMRRLRALAWTGLLRRLRASFRLRRLR